MKKRILACLLALVMLIGVLPITVLADDGATTYYVDANTGADDTGSGTQQQPFRTVQKAAQVAKSGDTISLGAGNYTLYGVNSTGTTKGKDLTFVGQGVDTTSWNIGAEVPDPDKYGTEYNGDYSLDGAGTITFKDMKLRSGKADYLGFIRADNTVVENCTVEGKTFYWGYTSATFTNTTFICPPGDYAVWTYSSPTMTFDHCTFESSGKIINVYTDYGAGTHDITVNFKNCTVNNSAHIKQVLKINDSNMGNYKYILNISGDNKVSGVEPNGTTCSRMFGFEGSQNSGRTVVYIEGEKVWEKGVRVGSHSQDFTTGSYDDGVAEGTANKYTEGYKDNAFDILEATEWAPQSDGSYKRTVKRVCKYCGYTETVEETKRDEVDDITAVLLPALQANTDDHYSYLIGYADGTVRPNGKITRAEVATIFFRLLDDDTRAKYWSSENNFSDVSADKWYNNAVSTLSRMGVIGGYADGTFRPNAPISRAEFAKIAVSFTQNNGSAVYNYFTDVKTTDWFAPYVTAAKDAGLIEGYSDGSFKPESKITRAEACAIVNRTLGRKPSKAHMKISDRIDWPDVQTTDWFYEAIMEATNSHTCTMGDRVETWTGKLPQRDWATLETGWANAYTGR